MRLTAVLVSVALLTGCAAKAIEIVGKSSDQTLRTRPAGARQSSPDAPPVLVLALDGVSRAQLYDLVRAGKMPNLATLLGGDDLSHAYFDESVLSTLPSTTMAAWVTAMTGVGPAEHGVTGNEYFIREKREFACPAPVSFNDPAATLSIYTDRYLDKLVDAPTVYERLRANDPNILIWITMNHLFRGADRMLLAKRTALLKAFEGLAEHVLDTGVKQKTSPKLYATLDTAAVDVLMKHLAKGPLPDVLTLYLSGTDLYAHVAAEGPDAARDAYLREVVDPQLGRVVAKLRERKQLDRLWVVMLADHGHTPVLHDTTHALGTGDDAGPPGLLRAAGFRVRPFKKDVDPKDPFSAVLAYGGAMAYVYLADRSQCVGSKDVCPWQAPPRYKEDVLAAADAFYRANEDGTNEPRLKGTLDMILVRKPKPVADIDLPFEVYIGDGKTQPLPDYLAAHPHPTYVYMDERLHDLAVGVHGERAGDILLLAHNGDRDDIAQRYYFAAEYHSWHGSPSRADSEIPFIVANHHHQAAEIGNWVHRILGKRPFIQKTTDVIIGLREGKLGD